MKVALVQHFLSHYRYTIFHKLSLSKSNKFVIFSDIKGVANIKTIDSRLANVPPELGGLNWKFIQNFYIGKHFLWQSGIIQLAMSREFDAIIFLGNMYHLSTWLGAILARICGKKVFMWTHGFLREENNIKGSVRFLFYRLAHGLMLYGNLAKNILIKKGYPNNMLEVVYNSLDYDSQLNVRNTLTTDFLLNKKKSLFTNFDLPVLMFIGRLTSQKKLHQLLEATKILHERSCPVNVLFVGSGPEMGRLLSIVADIGLSDFVHFYGETYDEFEIGSLISISDICVSPGEVGLTCMHAMAYGVPVITHDNFEFQGPEVEAIQPGISGCFFKQDDVRSLTDCLRNVLNSTNKKNDFKTECINVIEAKYNIHVQFETINNFLNKL